MQYALLHIPCRTDQQHCSRLKLRSVQQLPFPQAVLIASCAHAGGWAAAAQQRGQPGRSRPLPEEQQGAGGSSLRCTPGGRVQRAQLPRVLPQAEALWQLPLSALPAAVRAACVLCTWGPMQSSCVSLISRAAWLGLLCAVTIMQVHGAGISCAWCTDRHGQGQALRRLDPFLAVADLLCMHVSSCRISVCAHLAAPGPFLCQDLLLSSMLSDQSSTVA